MLSFLFSYQSVVGSTDLVLLQPLVECNIPQSTLLLINPSVKIGLRITVISLIVSITISHYRLSCHVSVYSINLHVLVIRD